MATTPISGKLGKVTYGSGPTTLAVTDWSMNNSAGTLDLPNTVDGRLRIPGLGDADGDFNVHVDTAVTTEADLAVGTILALNLYTDGTKKYAIAHAIIDKIAYKNAVEGSYDAAVTWKLASGVPTNAPA
jgi:hypothetical protein